jgi:hypothetical protein
MAWPDSAIGEEILSCQLPEFAGKQAGLASFFTAFVFQAA